MKTHLVWFRNDLRVIDNPALTEACSDPEAKVIALFVATPKQWQQHGMSARQAQFIYDNLNALQASLAALGIPLIYQQCNTFDESIPLIEQICVTQSVTTLFYNRQYEVNEQTRDAKLETRISLQTQCIGLDGNLFFPPLTILNGQQEMYKVFTPFSRAFLSKILRHPISVSPSPEKRSQTVKENNIPIFDYPMQSYDYFKAGEDNALTTLADFCREQVEDYAHQRDIPSIEGTSKLSAYLALGVISVRQCFYQLQLEYPLFWQNPSSGAFCWFNELVWREFYQHLLTAYPFLCKHKPFIKWTNAIHWNDNQDTFNRWKEGKTGYPIVDAAMRQLNQTGWMHNRLRMIVASFLVKDLLIDWRWGEQYFISQLTDGDLAANNGGWQWAASTGTDAAPYFRIFNPTTQGQRFDPEGVFIKQWLPGLSAVPSKFIHTPHQWAEKLGQFLDYPYPIVNHATARVKTLEAFTEAKNI